MMSKNDGQQSRVMGMLSLTRFDPGRECWYVDDQLQVRYQDAQATAAGIALFEILPPNVGQYWLVDRVVISCDAGGTAVMTIFTNENRANNVVASKAATALELAIAEEFDTPLEIGSSEPLVVAVAGNAEVESHVIVWYRRRTIVPSPYDEKARVFVEEPQPPAGVSSTEPVGDAPTPVVAEQPTPLHHPEPLAPTGMLDEDPTYL